MKLVKALTICVLGTSTLFASSLIQKAMDNGLKPIPARKTELMTRMIQSPKRKLNLVRNYILIQDFQRVD